MFGLSSARAIVLGLMAALLIGGGVPSARAQSNTSAPSYLEIPLKGTFGEDFNAAGVHAALKHAKSKSIPHIVFTIDSPGGVVVDANAIAAAMDEFDADFIYTCVITKAYSASIWVMSRCDNIFFAEGAASGAAVAFSTDTDTGSAKVDAKLNSALASSLGAAAEKRGHPGLIFQAMILPELEVYVITEADGKRKFVGTEPAKGTNFEVLDRQGQILSLTANDAVRIGLARSLPKADVKLVGPAMGIGRWTSTDNTGIDQMKKTKQRNDNFAREVESLDKRLTRIDEDLTKAFDRLRRDIARAQATAQRDPLMAKGPWRDAKSSLDEIGMLERDATALLKSRRFKVMDWYKFRRLNPAPEIEEVKTVDLGIDKDEIYRLINAGLAVQ
ncbi:MAG: hypothetical protein K2X32_05335 [Phycisphaerales bacterium]|nr:hypothetical protein [Phycisphaerales bacterium]